MQQVFVTRVEIPAIERWRPRHRHEDLCSLGTEVEVNCLGAFLAAEASTNKVKRGLKNVTLSVECGPLTRGLPPASSASSRAAHPTPLRESPRVSTRSQIPLHPPLTYRLVMASNYSSIIRLEQKFLPFLYTYIDLHVYIWFEMCSITYIIVDKYLETCKLLQIYKIVQIKLSDLIFWSFISGNYIQLVDIGDINSWYYLV